MADNIDRLMHKMHLENLPLDFQHAILVAVDLGYEFLWIDSLCCEQYIR